ncbi:hypothetical protein PGTUg99_033840 [Puccinia graminis f. sp. tritici]|uniref:Uncharacterized protein n=1 Tax=Puccinia graminis f. sp. tritici TaxID=56615 RepID=A0A5B0QSZ1_PUCGR|nr:hypothetical protein PGTUg99_033840 [Puccinia graminis f. sp. tritici]
MQAFEASLSIIIFLIFFSSYHSLEINRLQARSLSSHSSQIVSSASKPEEAVGKSQNLGHLGSSGIKPSISEGIAAYKEPIGLHVPLVTPNSKNPLENAKDMPQKSEKTLIFQSSDDTLKIHHPNPLAEDSLKTLPKDETKKSKFVAFFQKLKSKIVNVWKDLKYMYRNVFRNPLPDLEVVRFENARNMIGKHLALGGCELEEASGKPFSLKNFAKTLDEKFPIFLSYDNRAQVEMLYEYYLKFLKQYQLISDENNVARKSWMSNLQTEKLADHEETKAEISKCLKELQQPNIKKKFKKNLIK